MPPDVASSRVTRALREGGVRLLVARGAHSMLSPLVQLGNVEFFVRDLREPVPEVAHGLVIEEAPPSTAAFLLLGRDRPDEVAREIRRRFERGDRCIVARDNEGRYLHTRWVSVRPTYIPELGRCVAPRAGQAYMYDGYTRPEARGKGVDGAIRAFIFARMRDAGFDEVLSYVRGSNAAGLAAARKWQQSAGSVGYVTWRGRTRHLRGRSRVAERLDLIKPAEAAAIEAEREQRQTALREWFQSWLVEPMDKRSTGFSALPDAYFESAGSHIVETLALDPAHDEVLDVGCASGGISRVVAPSARRLVGVDLTAGLVEDIDAESIVCADGAPATFSVADARALPFPPGAFDKVYCTGVIHMLPSHDDAVRAVDELVRVCRPGGTVLVGAVPDAAKRHEEWRLLWRRGDLKQKAKLAVTALLPARMRKTLKRALQREPGHEVAFLKFDLAALAERYRARGLACQIIDYPADYWSEDFRTTRTCLLMQVPQR